MSRLQPNHFPDLCTIQQPVEGQDSYGQVTRAWAALIGHVNLRCRLAPEIQRSGEFQPQGQTYGRHSHRLLLSGYYPTITAKMRVVVGGESYQVVLVQPDSEGWSTRLLVDVVE
jgi:head-tail adaptor